MLVVSTQFSGSYMISQSLKDFNQPYVHPQHSEEAVIIGFAEDIGHHFGPLIKLEKDSSVMRIRIPWHHVLGIIHGRDAKQLGFVPAHGA
jgi:hypothetical protein